MAAIPMFRTAIEMQAFHEGLKAGFDARNPYSHQSPAASRAWSQGNAQAFRLSARLGVQYLNGIAAQRGY
ncbi:MAG: hypothetical protein H7A09_01350 [Oceanospirillaceae bacterium]|nr:hypothetical protein [Oceanospirillaceae bacterium]MCP5336024.1 hypothetical protein [Oceanospirillaceae bacterium]MCP5350249.1 hypothetical protein [Oceanospirillaceae bacterium]